MFTRQAVAELVQHLDDRHRDAEINPVLWTEELVKRRQLSLEFVKMCRDEARRRTSDQSDDNHHPPAEEPAGVFVEPVEEPLGIDAAEAKGKDVGQLAHQLAEFL